MPSVRVQVTTPSTNFRMREFVGDDMSQHQLVAKLPHRNPYEVRRLIDTTNVWRERIRNANDNRHIRHAGKTLSRDCSGHVTEPGVVPTGALNAHRDDDEKGIKEFAHVV